jgi:succinate-acetate transporter protein
MTDPDDAKVEGRIHGEQFEPKEADSLWMRLVFMIIIAVMISFAQTVLGIMTVIQFVIMVISNKEPNARLADFGTDLGVWVAKAARYQTAASNVKPWPWTDLD